MKKIILLIIFIYSLNFLGNETKAVTIDLKKTLENAEKSIKKEEIKLASSSTSGNETPPNKKKY